MQKKINIRVGECAMNPDATQPTQALSFLCQRHRSFFFYSFHVFSSFLIVSGVHFSYAFCIFSFLNRPHNEDWGSHVYQWYFVAIILNFLLKKLADLLLRKVTVLSPMTPASVAQLDTIFWLYSLFSVGGIFTLNVFSSVERDLSRRWRLWEIYISTAEERFISLLLPRIPMSLAQMFAHLFFHASLFLPSHISISLVKHADWGQLLGTDYKLSMWLAAFPFGAFRMLLSRSMRKTSVTQERP